jgi:hypothetical protein
VALGSIDSHADAVVPDRANRASGGQGLRPYDPDMAFGGQGYPP